MAIGNVVLLLAVDTVWHFLHATTSADARPVLGLLVGFEFWLRGDRGIRVRRTRDLLRWPRRASRPGAPMPGSSSVLHR
jgi:hypothetical protein